MAREASQWVGPADNWRALGGETLGRDYRFLPPSSRRKRSVILRGSRSSIKPVYSTRSSLPMARTVRRRPSRGVLNSAIGRFASVGLGVSRIFQQLRQDELCSPRLSPVRHSIDCGVTLRGSGGVYWHDQGQGGGGGAGAIGIQRRQSSASTPTRDPPEFLPFIGRRK